MEILQRVHILDLLNTIVIESKILEVCQRIQSFDHFDVVEREIYKETCLTSCYIYLLSHVQLAYLYLSDFQNVYIFII